ncbi:MAG: DedA family protein [Alphaproteobacteria bacterium]|nr:DedA family protein [Alphaproteobacteria bacterium]
MEEFLQNILTNYGYLLYLVILGWTFLEGETVVLITGAIASEGIYDINIELVALCACVGSFLGDQLYYYIGRLYGTPLLARWPSLTKRIEWAFKLVRTHETLFILSFRFIYGIRNVSPFVVGMAGVPRLRFAVLNMIAALIWAHVFAWGGYLLGRALEKFLGDHKLDVLLGFVGIIVVFVAIGRLRNWVLNRRADAALRAAAATAEPAPPAKQPADAD